MAVKDNLNINQSLIMKNVTEREINILERYKVFVQLNSADLIS